MPADHEQLDLGQLTVSSCKGDPFLVAEALQVADGLLESGDHRRAADVLNRLAGLLLPSDCRLPPLVRCHVFARLGGVLAGIGDRGEAETWLRRAVELAELRELSKSNCRDFQRMLDFLLEGKPPRRTAPSPDATTNPDAKPETSMIAEAAVETDAVNAMCSAHTTEALQQLSDESRTLIELRFIHQYSTDEIAKRLGLSRQELLERLEDARIQFHQALSQIANEDSAAVSADPPTSEIPPVHSRPT
jgi:RNA polymerase sigma factor (sigma-70 family)